MVGGFTAMPMTPRIGTCCSRGSRSRSSKHLVKIPDTTITITTGTATTTPPMVTVTRTGWSIARSFAHAKG